MIIPCIDLLGGKVVQLVQGRRKALEAEEPEVLLEKFAAFSVIQVIDLDQALGTGSNQSIVRRLAGLVRIWAGGGVRSPERARELVDAGAERVIIGTAAFATDGPDRSFLERVGAAVGPRNVTVALDSRGGRIVIKGWRKATQLAAEDLLDQLEPLCGGFLCTYVDQEGTLRGTDLQWYRRLRAATGHEIIAAGGIATLEEVRALLELDMHVALGMAVYTGRLDLGDLADLQRRAGGRRRAAWQDGLAGRPEAG